MSISLQGDIYYDLKEFSKARLLYEESKNILLEQSNLYNKKTIVKRLIQLYFQQNDICFIGTLIDDVKKICDPIQQKELINIIKVEIYKNLLNNNVQFIPLLNEYLA